MTSTLFPDPAELAKPGEGNSPLLVSFRAGKMTHQPNGDGSFTVTVSQMLLLPHAACELLCSVLPQSFSLPLRLTITSNSVVDTHTLSFFGTGCRMYIYRWLTHGCVLPNFARLIHEEAGAQLSAKMTVPEFSSGLRVIAMTEMAQ